MHRNAVIGAGLIAFFLALSHAVTPVYAAQVAAVASESPGTIVVNTSQRRLYLVVSEGHAVSYPVGVGKAGKQWSGTSYIASKHLRPAWSPPEEIKHDRPFLPAVIPS